MSRNLCNVVVFSCWRWGKVFRSAVNPTAGTVGDPYPWLMPHALIASGGGRYADPWHPFPDTSRAIADLLTEGGWTVQVDEDVDGALTRLAGVDLLVVNAGDPWRSVEGQRFALPAASEGLTAALAAGTGVLAVHAAVSSLRDYPVWRHTIAGDWVPERSWHPEISEATIDVVDPDHPVTAGIESFTLWDERYTDLDVDLDVQVLAVHEEGGRRHPLLWVRDLPTGRVAVSLLGHDERSFASAPHRRLLQQAAGWAARQPVDGPDESGGAG